MMAAVVLITVALVQVQQTKIMMLLFDLWWASLSVIKCRTVLFVYPTILQSLNIVNIKAFQNFTAHQLLKETHKTDDKSETEQNSMAAQLVSD